MFNWLRAIFSSINSTFNAIDHVAGMAEDAARTKRTLLILDHNKALKDAGLDPDKISEARATFESLVINPKTPTPPAP